MKLILLFFVNILLVIGYSPVVEAVCSGYNIQQNQNITVSPKAYSVGFSTSNLTVQRDWGVGRELASVLTPYRPDDYYGSCTYNGTGTYYGTMTYGKVEKSGIENVYKTNVPGIGIKVQGGSGVGSLYFNSPKGSLFAAYGPWANAQTQYVVSLVQIGVVSPGTVEAGEVGYVSFDATPTLKSLTIYLGSSVNIVAASCSIQTPDINVKLDDVSSADLNAVGKAAKLKNFNVGLDCDPNAKVNVKLTGNKNTDTSASGVLQLTNAGSAGVAKGVGIQMVYNNAPMVLDENVLLKTSPGGTETFTFGAQYYQTKSDVSMGSANATATLEVTYQ